jgi:hypothetical protein
MEFHPAVHFVSPKLMSTILRSHRWYYFSTASSSNAASCYSSDWDIYIYMASFSLWNHHRASDSATSDHHKPSRGTRGRELEKEGFIYADRVIRPVSTGGLIQLYLMNPVIQAASVSSNSLLFLLQGRSCAEGRRLTQSLHCLVDAPDGHKVWRGEGRSGKGDFAELCYK